MNDLDFIKAKFEDSGISAPKDLNKENILEKVNNIKPKKKSGKGIYISVAACVAVLIAALVSVNVIYGNFTARVKPDNFANITQKEVSGIKSFSSRKQIVSEVAKIKKMKNELENMQRDDEGSSSVSKKVSYSDDSGTSSGNSGNSDYKGTYLQYENVDEEDTVKTDGKYIYKTAISNEEVEVYSAQGKNSKLIKKIVPFRKNKKGERLINQINGLYVYKGKLVVICTFYDEDMEYELTAAELYDVTDIDNVKLTDEFYQSGTDVSSRIIGSKLYLITEQFSWDKNDLPKVINTESTADEVKEKQLSAKDIFSIDKPTYESFVVISAIDLNNMKNSVTRAILGCSDEVYCNENNLYILGADGLSDYGYGIWGRYAAYKKLSKKTVIIKISLKDAPIITACTRVKGKVNNQYSLDEKDGNLRIATSSYKENGDFKNNNLFVLDSNLNKIGRVANFAKGEEIKAVRYVKNTAYVITYKETDPLFVIDLSNSNNPKIRGSVKISGFSTMLVPVDENTLLGIGYHTTGDEEDGLKLAVFDVSGNPKVADKKSFKYYYSEAMDDPKALLVNEKQSVYSVPYEHSDGHYFSIYPIKSYGGVLNFKVKNGKLVQLRDVRSKKLEYVYRCVYIDDTIYMLGLYDDDPDCVKYK